MFSLKSASWLISNVARFSLGRQISMSTLRQADSDEWKPNTSGQETEENAPFSGGLEKSLYIFYDSWYYSCFDF